MASLDTTRPAAQTIPGRNPRRRTRQEIEGGSLRIGQPDRKRSKLANGFAGAPYANGSPNGTAMPFTNGRANELNGRYSASPALSDIPVRSKATTSRRSGRAGPLEILTKNERYQIGKSPSLPDQLRDSDENYRASSLPSTTLTLALTRSRAIIWDAANADTAKSTRIFSLPYPSKTNDALPIGALVRTAQDTETGLVVIAPRSGKITFWENIENADALSLFQQRRNGTEGSVGSMLSGETVSDITSADDAGFIISFSSGRVAQLLLRDSQSRPSVSVAFLRSAKSSAGLFSGFWNAFTSGGFLKNVAAVKCRPSRSRGLTDVVLTTDEAFLQYWHCSWSGQPTLEAEIDGRERLTSTVGKALGNFLPSEAHNVKLLDFVISSSPSKVQNALFRLQTLCQVSGPSFTTYALADIEVSEQEPITLHDVVPIRSYSPPLTPATSWFPRLLMPPRASTAFVVFDKAVSIISFPTQTTSRRKTDYRDFQDTIYLKDDDETHVVGADIAVFDQKNLSASMTFYVRQHGVLRMTVNEDTCQNDSSESFELSVLNKIEQAVLYGTKPSNPLNLSRRPDSSIAKADVENAALEVSIGILSSQYPDALPDTSSMDADLQRRAKALEDLAKHVKFAYPGLSRSTRWRLCWYAERLAAARQMWADHDLAVQTGVPNWIDPEAHQLGHWCMAFSESVSGLDETLRSIPGELDRATFDRMDQLRMYLHRDIWRIEHVFESLAGMVQYVHSLCPHPKDDSEQYFSILSEAGDMVIRGIQSAYSFRDENAWLYDLDREDMQDGVLQSGYEAMPEFWTSLLRSTSSASRVAELAQGAATTHVAKLERQEVQVSETVKKIAADSPALIKIADKMWHERFLWAAGQPQEELQQDEQGDSLKQSVHQQRTELLEGLTAYQQTEAGIQLADGFGDMKALSSLISIEVQNLLEDSREFEIAPPGETAAEERQRRYELDRVREQTRALEARMKANCEKFGYAWTKHSYAPYIERAAFAGLLDHSKMQRSALTEFLRKEPGRKRLAWINEVLNENNYLVAGEDLVNAAVFEQQRWHKEVYSGFSKLALLAAEEAEPGSRALKAYGAVYERTKSLSNIQDQLSKHVSYVTHNALDKKAMTQLLMEAYGEVNVRSNVRSSLRALLEQGFSILVAGQVMEPEVLVDVLTLMDSKANDPGQHDISRKEFYLALEAVRKGDDTLDSVRQDLLELMVWRRCFLHDEWEKINRTARKSDEEIDHQLRETALFQTFYEAYTSGLMAPNEPNPAPSTCLTSGTRTADYLPRLHTQELAEPIAADTSHETDDLKELLEHHRLEHWINSTRALAWRAVEADRDIAENNEEVAIGNVRDQARVEMHQVSGLEGLRRACMPRGRAMAGDRASADDDEQFT